MSVHGRDAWLPSTDPAAPPGVELGREGRKTGMGMGAGTGTFELGTGICSSLACGALRWAQGSAGSHCHQALVMQRGDRGWL